MIHPETHPVTPDRGPRPAGPPDQCFYCDVVVGGEHTPDCVMRDRTVVVRMTVEYVIRVPESWDKEQIEFHRNEGSWCADNAVEELAKGHLCPVTQFEYVREATEEDERTWPTEDRA